MSTKILVVEDEIVVADHLCSNLIELGYICTEPAMNYTEALQRLKSERPDLAILDVNLSGRLSGIDLGAYILENVGIPIIYLTAYSDAQTLASAKATKPMGYLIKPYKKADLRPAIEIALLNYANQPHNQEEVKPDNLLELMTIRELEIIKKIAASKSTKRMADELSLSVSTIKNHRHNICEKLGLPPANNSLLAWVMLNHDRLVV